MLGILKDNLYAVAAYWWVIVVGVVMPFLDLLKFLHPTKHWEFKLHPSLRIAIAALALIIAEFLAYKDQASNLAAVIEAKRQLSMQLNSKNTEIAQLQQQTVGAVPSASGAAVLKILYHGQSLRAGNRWHHCSALGKLLIGWLPDEEYRKSYHNARICAFVF